MLKNGPKGAEMTEQNTLEQIDVLKREIQELKSQATFFSSLIDMSVVLTSTFDLDELIRRVLEISQGVMNSEASNVMLLNEEKAILECRVALGEVGSLLEQSFTLKLGQGIAGWVAEHKQSVVVPDVSKDHRFYSGTDKKTGFVTRSIMACPLISQNKMLGVAEVVNRRDGQPFSGQDLEKFETFCRGVSVAVQNARMHRELLQNQRVQQQLEMASAIQQGFLPRSFSLENEQLEISAINLPASMVGGDFYDCIELRPGLYGITIGDVSGKGMPAALYMARLISDFRFEAHQREEPESTMTRLNKMLAERSQAGMFVTMIYLILDTHHGELRYVNGGHIPPILFQRRGDRLDHLNGSEGIPLGIQRDAPFGEAEYYLRRGDTMLLFSDGLLDAKNSKGEKFNFSKIENYVRGKWQTPHDLVTQLVEAVTNHAGDESQFDDITIMAIRWR
jgi:sigma-B regulation protein RsbU (phosphoserine phosphatase)